MLKNINNHKKVIDIQKCTLYKEWQLIANIAQLVELLICNRL
uniref:Uncharacterized protein n=1 Tax=Siphoviridae sp. ctpbe1 TaxID=2826466 RepID=A0A8S5NQR0_9CAUD|nr:MAG TPA: hypothetical protein [Siphoviridae sp. ctpbe1]